MKLRVTMIEDVEVPDGSEIHCGPTGMVAGFRLPSGELVRPWITYEIEDHDGETRDLEQEELAALGIVDGEDGQRQVEEL